VPPGGKNLNAAFFFSFSLRLCPFLPFDLFLAKRQMTRYVVGTSPEIRMLPLKPKNVATLTTAARGVCPPLTTKLYLII